MVAKSENPTSFINVYLHPAAADEAEAALEWYATRSPRAAERFWKRLAETIGDISRSPQRFPTFHAGTQRALLRDFLFHRFSGGPEPN